MPKFTLIAEHTDIYGKPDGTKVNYEFHCDFLPEVIEHMDLFLRGCGFNPTGTLDYVQEDYFEHSAGDQEWIDPEFEIPIQPAEHSNYYFDTERNK